MKLCEFNIMLKKYKLSEVEKILIRSYFHSWKQLKNLEEDVDEIEEDINYKNSLIKELELTSLSIQNTLKQVIGNDKIYKVLEVMDKVKVTKFGSYIANAFEVKDVKKHFGLTMTEEALFKIFVGNKTNIRYYCFQLNQMTEDKINLIKEIEQEKNVQNSIEELLYVTSDKKRL